MTEIDKYCDQLIEGASEEVVDKRSGLTVWVDEDGKKHKVDKEGKRIKVDKNKENQITGPRTLFYILLPKLSPIFVKQPDSDVQGKVIIHAVRHAEVRVSPVPSSFLETQLIELSQGPA